MKKFKVTSGDFTGTEIRAKDKRAAGLVLRAYRLRFNPPPVPEEDDLDEGIEVEEGVIND